MQDNHDNNLEGGGVRHLEIKHFLGIQNLLLLRMLNQLSYLIYFQLKERGGSVKFSSDGTIETI